MAKKIAGAYTSKILIHDEQGNIVRTLTLPYPGTLLDISDMPDKEWEDMTAAGIHIQQIDIDPATNEHRKDARGLPVIKKKS